MPIEGDPPPLDIKATTDILPASPSDITASSLQTFLHAWNTRNWPAAAAALELLIRNAESAEQIQLAQVLRHLRGIAANFSGYYGVAKAVFEAELEDWDGTPEGLTEGSRECAALTWLGKFDFPTRT